MIVETWADDCGMIGAADGDSSGDDGVVASMSWATLRFAEGIERPRLVRTAIPGKIGVFSLDVETTSSINFLEAGAGVGVEQSTTEDSKEGRGVSS